MGVERKTGSVDGSQSRPSQNVSSDREIKRGTSSRGLTVANTDETAKSKINLQSKTKIGRSFQDLKESYTNWKANYCSPLSKYLQKAEKKKIGKILEKGQLTRDDVEMLMACKYEGKEALKNVLKAKDAEKLLVLIDLTWQMRKAKSKKDKITLSKSFREMINNNQDFFNQRIGPQFSANYGLIEGYLNNKNFNEFNYKFMLLPQLDALRLRAKDEVAGLLKSNDTDVAPHLWGKYEEFISDAGLKRLESEKIKSILAKKTLTSEDVDVLMKCKHAGKKVIYQALANYDDKIYPKFYGECFEFLDKSEQFKKAKTPKDRQRLFDEIQSPLKKRNSGFDFRLGGSSNSLGKYLTHKDIFLFSDAIFLNKTPSYEKTSEYFDDLQDPAKKSLATALQKAEVKQAILDNLT